MNEEKFPMTLIDNRLLDELLMEAAGPDPNSPPSFTPTPDLGEGTPSDDEMTYRREILVLLGLLFLSVRDIQKGIGSGYQKQQQIQGAIDNWLTDAKSVVDRNLDKNHYSGVRDADKQLLEKGITPTGAQARQAYYDIIHQQQLNLDSIGRELSDNLRGNLAMQTAESNFGVSKQAKTQSRINSFFNKSQNRLEKMAAFGSTAAYIEGQMASFYDWQKILLLDWVTSHDKRVCRECYAYESNSPYTMDKFPFPPHPYCRCRAVINERVPQDMGMFLPLALTTEDLLNQNQG